MIIRVSIPLLAAAYWMLGDVKRSYWINDSPDGKFFTSLVHNTGWRSFDIKARFLVYVTDKRTGENVLAADEPMFCYWNRIALDSIKWDKTGSRFICLWAIEDNGAYEEYVHLKTEPLRAKVGLSCCGLTE